MPEAFINIGSNLGDRQAHIEQAVAAIEQRFETTVRRAPMVYSRAWGYDSENDYVNLGIAVECGDMSPMAVLKELLRIEQEIDSGAHRTADGGYADRAIDVDLIAMGDAVVDEEQLQLPHPRMHLREFVLEPIAVLSPEWRHPLLGLTAEEMLELLRG